MSAQQDRLDREMLRSMATALSSGLDFSFNRQDMADLLSRMSRRIDPKPSALAASPDVQALIAEAVAKERERCAVIADGYHQRALAWAKTVRGLDQHIGKTDSSRIAATIRACDAP